MEFDYQATKTLAGGPLPAVAVLWARRSLAVVGTATVTLRGWISATVAHWEPSAHGQAPALSAAVAIASGVLLAGCGTTQANTGGFVSGDGSLTVLPADERPQAPVIEASRWMTSGGMASTSPEGDRLQRGFQCAPCRLEAPALVAASQKLADQVPSG